MGYVIDIKLFLFMALSMGSESGISRLLGLRNVDLEKVMLN